LRTATSRDSFPPNLPFCFLLFPLKFPSDNFYLGGPFNCSPTVFSQFCPRCFPPLFFPTHVIRISDLRAWPFPFGSPPSFLLPSMGGFTCNGDIPLPSSFFDQPCSHFQYPTGPSFARFSPLRMCMLCFAQFEIPISVFLPHDSAGARLQLSRIAFPRRRCDEDFLMPLFSVDLVFPRLMRFASPLASSSSSA